MTADVELLPLPKPEPQVSVAGAHEAMLADALEDYFDTEAVQTYARAVAEHNVKALRAEVAAVWNAMPSGTRYLDPPDGGDVPLHEQVRRMAADAARAEQLQAELDNRWATGVHTCHDKCQRIACVLRRDNKRLAESLRWYVENDDTNEGQEGNEYWLAGRDRAIAVLRDHDQENSRE